MAAVKKKAIAKAPAGSKRLKAGAKAHVKGERVQARMAVDGTRRFSRLNDEGTVSEWKVVPKAEGL